MTAKHLCILLLALVAAHGVAAQSEDIPIENDNQFPPEKTAEVESDVIEGSGGGVLEEPPVAEVGSTAAPVLEEVQPTNVVLESAVSTPDGNQSTCPRPCVCHYDGGSEKFVVDCSGYDLKEFPSPIDPKTTTLNLQQNKLTEIPKEISSLKNLRVLNAENNMIRELVLGSVSELQELTVLKLGNNRLIDYPQDLKNSFSMTKLEELDLGGNEIREELKPELFSNFKVLRQLTLPTSTPELLKDLCSSMQSSLHSVCTDTCTKQLQDCDALPSFKEEDLLPVLPGALYDGISSEPNNNNVNTEGSVVNTEENVTEGKQESSSSSPLSRTFSGTVTNVVEQQQSKPSEENAVKDQEDKQNLETQKNGNPEADVNVGATTAEGKNAGGGVDKSVIGIVVAAMVVVVAGITIKKNWSSIKRKFSSTPRPADRAGANANGTTLPEEVPLQDKDKSPV